MRSRMSVVVLAVSLVAAAATSALAAGQGWLGVTTQSTDADLRRGLDLTRDGLLVNSVSRDSPADRAGIEKGDVILSYNSRSVTEPSDLRQLVRDTEPGRTVTLTIWRDGARRTIEVRVGELPASEDESFDTPVPRAPEPPSPPRAPRAPRSSRDTDRSEIRIDRDDDGKVKRKMWVNGRELTEDEMDEKMKDLDGDWFDSKDLKGLEGLKHLKGLDGLKDIPGMRGWSGWSGDDGRTFAFTPSSRGRLGVRVERLTDDLAQALGTEGDQGVLVVQVLEDTPAQKAGIRAGDVIVRVGKDDVNDPDGLVKSLEDRNGSVDIVVLRKGVRRTIQAELRQARTPRAWSYTPSPNDRRVEVRIPELDGNPRGYREKAKDDQRSDADLREELRQLRRELEQLRREMGQRR